METFRLLYLAIGPGVAIAVYIYYADKWDPEPKSLVIKCFLLGALACFPAGLYEEGFQIFFGLEEIFKDDAEYLFWQIAFYAFFGVALAEEFCKFLFIKAFIFDERDFNEPFDGIVYGGIVGCGYATMENLLYVFQGGYNVGITRMLTAVPSHAFEGIILGYFIGKAKFSPDPVKHLTLGVVLVIVLHGIYDTAALSKVNWAIYAVFGMVVLGVYLGLKAKKELEKHSEFIESSPMAFFVFKGGKKLGPMVLKDIRNALANGKLGLDDTLIAKRGGKIKSIREHLFAEIGSKHKGWPRMVPRGQAINQFMLFYILTFGLYIYFWFYRNNRDFRNCKNVELNPELRAMGLFVITFVPYYLYGSIMGLIGNDPFAPYLYLPFNLLLAGIESAFWFFQFAMIKTFMRGTLKRSFPLTIIMLFIFALSSIRKIIPHSIPHYMMTDFVLILFQGAVLAFVQKDLNAFWKKEKQCSLGSL